VRELTLSPFTLKAGSRIEVVDNCRSKRTATDALFYTVSNAHYFAGTVATLSSIRTFHPQSEIWVFADTREPFNETQWAHLRSLPNVHCVAPDQFHIGRVREAWQLKAHAAHHVAALHEGVLVQVDSDAVLCSPLHDLFEEAYHRRLPAGGKDGAGAYYSRAEYAPYHALCGSVRVDNDAFNANYISTSILILPVPALRDTIALWSRAVDEAVFGPETQERKVYAGHGDQGVLNAILYFKGLTPIALQNELLSEHWTHGQTEIEWREGKFWNGSQPQRAFHSVGDVPKFWEPEYVSYVEEHPVLRVVYAYWLYQLCVGPCGVLRLGIPTRAGLDRAALFPTVSHDLREVYLHFDEDIRDTFRKRFALKVDE
jgi:hypothetical protein